MADWRMPPGSRLWLYVNFDCNLRCSYCVTGSGPGVRRPRLGLESFCALVEEATGLGFEQLAVSGGEPFLHPEILPMLDHAASRLPTVVLTNATLLGPRQIAGLTALDRRNLAVQVSLDSADPASNDRRRGHGSWVRAVAGLRRLLDQGFRVAVRATITGQTEAEIVDLRRFLAGLGVPEAQVYAMPVARGGRSTVGLDPAPGTLAPEPVAAGDGLYWHPLRVDPAEAIAREALPLETAVRRLVQRSEEAGETSPAGGYR